MGIPPAGMISSLGDRGPCEVLMISYFGPQIVTWGSLFSFFFLRFVYFLERERESTHTSGGRAGEGENLKQPLTPC